MNQQQVSSRQSALLPKEVGERLRQLRVRAGLSQEAVAVLCGLSGPGGKSYVCWVERGYLASGPSLLRLLDFLRACGCGIGELLEILDRHTGQPTAREEQAWLAVKEAIKGLPPRAHRRAFYYAVGMKHKAQKAIRNAAEVEKLVKQSMARGRAEERERRLTRVFNNVFNELKLSCSHDLALKLSTFGRMVFATLRRLRRSRPVWRDKALRKLDEWPLRWGDAPEPFQRMKAAVTELFEQMEQSGQNTKWTP